MYTISFAFDQEGTVYTTQPMTAKLALEFVADAINQAFYVAEITDLGGYRREFAPH